ncbi:hypothetical protein Gorai_007411, partial [Gossypium raimondii]|nr:hypothetical protein [Gossypium raimondii]
LLGHFGGWCNLLNSGLTSKLSWGGYNTDATDIDETTQNTILKAIYTKLWNLSIARVHQNVYGVPAFIVAYMQELDNLDMVRLVFQGLNSYTWEPPLGYVMKVNFCATIYQVTKIATTGILVRINEAFVMVACTYPFEHVADSIVAEPRSCLRVLIFMEELGFQEIVVEGDALTIIEKDLVGQQRPKGRLRCPVSVQDIIRRH